MGDKAWDGLLESPYDERERRRKSRNEGSNRGRVPRLAVGVLGASGIGALVGWALAPGVPEAAPTTTTLATTTTTTEAHLGDSGFLAGYTELGNTAFAPVVQFTSGDQTYVVVSEIVRAGDDRTEVAPTVVANYVAPSSTGGAPLRSLREITAILSPGIRVLEFERFDDPVALQVTAGTAPVTISSCPRCEFYELGGNDVVFEFAGFPMVLADAPITIDLGEGRSVVLDRLDINDEWGLVDWHVEASDGAVATVDIVVSFLGTESDQNGRAELVGPEHVGPRFAQSQPPAVPGFASAGRLQLFRAGPHITSENQPTEVSVRWVVTWSAPTTDAAVLAPAKPWGSRR
jgi:hypothetical protein